MYWSINSSLEDLWFVLIITYTKEKEGRRRNMYFSIYNVINLGRWYLKKIILLFFKYS